MPTNDDISTVSAGLIPEIQAAILRDVAPIVEDILKRHIQTDIYDAYTPKPGAWVDDTTYERRHDLEENITSSFISQDTMLTTSTATANVSVVPGYEFSDKYPGAFLELIGGNRLGIWRGGFARPAVANAQAEVDNSSLVQSAIRNSITQVLNRAR